MSGQFSLQPRAHFGTFADVRMIVAIGTLFIGISTAIAQEQERKLIDRVLKPDTSLGNSAQNKKFIASRERLVSIRAFRTRSFYSPAKTVPKSFPDERVFTPRQFAARHFRAGDSAANISTRSQLTKTDTVISTTAATAGTRVAPESGATVAGSRICRQSPVSRAGKKPEISPGSEQTADDRAGARIVEQEQVASGYDPRTRTMQPDEALSILKQGAAQVISEPELRAKLALGRPLRVKLGVDPTSPDLHLGHALILRKLRQFQDLGHEAILIIGDFTSMIGDPSGRSATRPQLSREQVAAPTQKPIATKLSKSWIRRAPVLSQMANGFRKMGFEEVIRLNSMVTSAADASARGFPESNRSGAPDSCPRNSIPYHARLGFSHGPGRRRTWRDRPALQYSRRARSPETRRPAPAGGFRPPDPGRPRRLEEDEQEPWKLCRADGAGPGNVRQAHEHFR